jgi:putative ABC transport system permease protein
MEHASVLLEQLAPPQPDLGAPGFWRDFLVGMLKPLAATAAVALAVALSFTQRLGIEREMLYAIARSFVQFSVVGFVLHFIFSQKNTAPWILLAYLFMVRVREFDRSLN